MFCIDLSPSYFWPVVFSVPHADGMRHQTVTFDVKFKRLDTDSIKALHERAATALIADREMALELMCGWRGITDRRGNEVMYDDAAVANLVKIPGAPAAIISAFWDSLVSRPDSPSAAEKN